MLKSFAITDELSRDFYKAFSHILRNLSYLFFTIISGYMAV